MRVKKLQTKRTRKGSQKTGLTGRSGAMMRRVGQASAGILGLLTLVMLCPVQPGAANAALPELTEGQSQATRATDTTVYIQSAISLALSSRVDVDVVPKANGAFSRNSATLSVATNNSTGYGIYMGTANGSQDLSLAGGSAESPAIKPVVGAVDEAEFLLQENVWGYKLSQTGVVEAGNDAKYQAVPGTTSQIRNISQTEVSASDSFDLSFGTNVNTKMAAGAYTNQVIVSVVANPRQIQNLREALFMQDFDGTKTQTSRICENSTVGDTTQVTDIRDGQKYWIAKLADGNCWMTQNLNLDLSTTKTLTPSDSDVTANWTPTINTSTTVPTPVASPSQTESRSWNMGDYVLATPQRGVTCNSAPAGGSTDNDGYNSLRPGQTFATQCPDFQKVDASWTYMDATIGTWETTANASAGGTAYTYSGLVAANKAEKKYDSHYLIGNYYQYGAATAGSGNSITTGNASSSICPKGWHLPNAGRDSNGLSLDLDDSFAKLFAAYGYPKPGNSAGWSGLGSNGNGYYAVNYEGATRLDGAPLYFVRSGYVYLPNGSLRYAGVNGYYWSAAAYSAPYAYYLYFNATIAYPSNSTNRYYGFPVRCVAL